MDFEYTADGQVYLHPVKSLSKRKKARSRFAALRRTGRHLGMSTDEYMNLIRGYDRDEDDPGFKSLR